MSTKRTREPTFTKILFAILYNMNKNLHHDDSNLSSMSLIARNERNGGIGTAREHRTVVAVATFCVWLSMNRCLLPASEEGRMHQPRMQSNLFSSSSALLPCRSGTGLVRTRKLHCRLPFLSLSTAVRTARLGIRRCSRS